MLYEFKLGYNTLKASKNICGAKVEDAVDQSTVTRWFKKFYLSGKNFGHQTRSTVDSETIFEAIEVNPVVAFGEYQVNLASHSLLPSQPWQKHSELPNFASHYQNIAKLLTHSSVKKIIYIYIYIYILTHKHTYIYI